MVNVSKRTGWLPIDENLEKFTQGSFTQYSGAYDHMIDFDVSTKQCRFDTKQWLYI